MQRAVKNKKFRWNKIKRFSQATIIYIYRMFWRAIRGEWKRKEMCVAPNPINNITVFLSRFLFHLARREKEVYPRFIDYKTDIELG